MSPRFPVLALAALAALPLARPAAQTEHARPPVFADLDFAGGLDKATQEQKLLVVDAMTSWCGPCKVMDRTTWVEPELVEWMRSNTVAIQLDMDVHQDVKQRLRISAYPTVVVFRDGEEFDRVVGLRDAAFMARWLSGAKSGKSGLDQAKEQLAALASDPAKAEKRTELCRRIAGYGAFDVIGPELLAIWREGVDDQGRPFRATALFTAISMAAGDPETRTTFTQIRDDLGRRVAAGGVDADPQELRDWIDLSASLDDKNPVVAWARDLADDPGGPALLQELEGRLYRTLLSTGEFAAAGHALADPVGYARARVRSLGGGAGDSVPEGVAVPMIPLKPRGGAAEQDDPPAVTPAIPMAPRRPAADDASAERPAMMPAIPLAPRNGSGRPAAAVADDPPRDPEQPRWDNPADPREREIEVRARVRYAVRLDLADRYGALLAAGRIEDASALAEVMLSELDGPRARAALVASALRAGQIDKRREAHQRWLDEAGT